MLSPLFTSTLAGTLQGALAKELGAASTPAPLPFVTQYAPLSAFSLQDLTGTNPNVVRVRRSSDNAEQDFTAPELTDGTLTDWVTGNGLVTTWYDQSGNGNDFTQSTASSQPKIVSAGVLVTGTNGLPAVELDGTDDNLRSAATFAGHATFDCYTTMEVGSESLYILYSEFSSGARRSFIAQSGNTNTTLSNNFGTPALYANGALQSPANRGDVFTAHAGQKIMTYLGADTSTWTNGYLSFYGTAEYAGKIQEMIFFNTDSSANRSAIETSINDRWSMY